MFVAKRLIVIKVVAVFIAIIGYTEAASCNPKDLVSALTGITGQTKKLSKCSLPEGLKEQNLSVGATSLTKFKFNFVRDTCKASVADELKKSVECICPIFGDYIDSVSDVMKNCDIGKGMLADNVKNLMSTVVGTAASALCPGLEVSCNGKSPDLVIENWKVESQIVISGDDVKLDGDFKATLMNAIGEKLNIDTKNIKVTLPLGLADLGNRRLSDQKITAAIMDLAKQVDADKVKAELEKKRGEIATELGQKYNDADIKSLDSSVVSSKSSFDDYLKNADAQTAKDVQNDFLKGLGINSGVRIAPAVSFMVVVAAVAFY